MESIRLRDIRFDVPILGLQGDSFNWIPYSSTILDVTDVLRADIEQPWNLDRFGMSGHFSIIGTTDPQLNFADNCKELRVLDLPIKTPGDHAIYLPDSITPLKSFINVVAMYDRAAFPNRYEDSFGYLTLDSGIVQPGTTQRHSGVHVDGFQGERLGDPLPTDRSYIAYNSIAPLLYDQPFATNGLDRSRHDFFDAFTRQIDRNETKGLVAKAGNIILTSCYGVHEARTNNTLLPIDRKFIRVSFSSREFDRLGNTVNPMFDLSWKMVPRDIHDQLDR